MSCAEPLPETKTDGPAELAGVLCLGGPKHNHYVADRGKDGYECKVEGKRYHYRWVVLALTGKCHGLDSVLQQKIYVLDNIEEAWNA
jgi:hypothetical protein